MILFVGVLTGDGLAESGPVNNGTDLFAALLFWMKIGGAKWALMEVNDALEVGEKS
jgi:hypothetical protein